MADKKYLEGPGLLGAQIEQEVRDYVTREVDIGDGVRFSQHKLVRRISLFQSKTYPKGKFDRQGNYKFWFDIIDPRVDSEVKNIDFDTSNIEAWSPRVSDDLCNVVMNLRLAEFLRKTGKAEELNGDIEEGSGWGNVIWKKVKKDYERCDLKNTYVINQTARTLNDSPVIERHQLSQTKLHKMEVSGKYQNCKSVIDSCSLNSYKSNESATGDETTTPYYLIFERNGEVSKASLAEYRRKEVKEEDKKQFVLAKVIIAATEEGGNITAKHIIFAQEITKMPYKEYHRGRYKGRWFREGLYELLFDCQVRANEVGNQLARGLEWASKTFFTSGDKMVIQNVLNDLRNGDIIKSATLKQLEVRMQGADQLIAEWNRIVAIANEIANSREIVQGGDLPAGMPFRLGAMLNTNANKLYDFIREKLSIPLREMFEEVVLPGLAEDIKSEDVLRLTGDPEMMKRLYEMVVTDWYIKNLVAIGPHGPEEAKIIKGEKMDELMKKPAIFLTQLREVFRGYTAMASVIITGENVDLASKMQTLATFIQLESDPVRRTYLIEKAMRMKGMDVAGLPRSTPDQLAGVKPETGQPLERAPAEVPA